MSKKKLVRIDYFKDYQLVAIISHLKDYTLCYNLNLNLDFNLVKYNDLVISIGLESESSFSWYFFKDEINNTKYYLLGNKSENGNLLKSQKTVDFFLLINNLRSNELLNPILDSLRKIPNVTALFELKMDQQKKMKNLLDLIELHESEVII